VLRFPAPRYRVLAEVPPEILQAEKSLSATSLGNDHAHRDVYSFKGGVGRTQALVNVGVELAQRGRRVLLVDLDLEAPGIDTYPLPKPKEPAPGIVEFVTEYLVFRRSTGCNSEHSTNVATSGQQGGAGCG